MSHDVTEYIICAYNKICLELPMNNNSSIELCDLFATGILFDGRLL